MSKFSGGIYESYRLLPYVVSQMKKVSSTKVVQFGTFDPI
jgi:hypothetical protein